MVVVFWIPFRLRSSGRDPRYTRSWVNRALSLSFETGLEVRCWVRKTNVLYIFFLHRIGTVLTLRVSCHSYISPRDERGGDKNISMINNMNVPVTITVVYRSVVQILCFNNHIARALYDRQASIPCHASIRLHILSYPIFQISLLSTHPFTPEIRTTTASRQLLNNNNNNNNNHLTDTSRFLPFFLLYPKKFFRKHTVPKHSNLKFPKDLSFFPVFWSIYRGVCRTGRYLRTPLPPA